MIRWLLLSSILAMNLPANAEDVDPFEEINRAIFELNEPLDNYIFEPIARAYQKSVPAFIQARVSGFFGNLADVAGLANQMLQFKIKESFRTLGRVTINTTMGVAGLFDVATGVGLSKPNEDFGQTLAVWGVDEGPYIMLPIFGPSTLRDSVGLYVDMGSDVNAINQLKGYGKTIMSLTGAVNKRAELLPITDLLSNSDDAYITLRSSYLQKRKNDIYDGNIPITDDDF